MVMHARKPQRLNDGYFDKHQSHQYQNSKYSSKRDYEREASSRSTNYGRDRDISPVGGSVINGNSYRSVSPELDSPRDRDRERDRDRGGDRYQSVYMQKMRDKERDRDYKKDKYSDCLRSPKDKRSRSDRDEHRTNHDRRSKLSSVSEKRGGSSSNSDDRDRDRDRERERNDRERDRDRGGERDRVNRIGDWSEHVSSSGKKYYYNCKTEVSQWEKPREWIDKERTLATSKEHRDYREKERDRERTDRDRERERDDRYMSTNRSSSYSKHSNSKNNSRMKWTRPDEGPTSHRRRHDDNQDMDISPDSTPTSEASYSHSSTPTIQQAHNTNNNSNNDGPVLLANARLVSNPQQMSASTMQHPHNYSMQIATSSPSVMQQQHLISSGHQSSDIMGTSNTPGPPNQGGGSLSAGQSSSTNMAPSSASSSSSSSLAGLPKILSQITGNKTIEPNELNPQKALQTINNALLMNSRQQMSDLGNSSNLREKTLNSPLYNISHLSHGSSASIINHSNQNNGISQTNQLISGDGSDFHGPPTPTQELDLINDHRKQGTTSTVSSLHSVMTSSQAGRPQGPNLTPSLANYFRADLISHVTGWPSEMLEKNVQKLTEEAHILGDLQCSKVSTELKCARSLVRITEITATLQEQKIMYLRQQIRRLEELKSQNSFMSSDDL